MPDDHVSFNLYLDKESLAVLKEEAASHGLKLSRWLMVLARFLKEPAPSNMPISELARRFKAIREEVEREKGSR